MLSSEKEGHSVEDTIVTSKNMTSIKDSYIKSEPKKIDSHPQQDDMEVIMSVLNQTMNLSKKNQSRFVTLNSSSSSEGKSDLDMTSGLSMHLKKSVSANNTKPIEAYNPLSFDIA